MRLDLLGVRDGETRTRLLTLLNLAEKGIFGLSSLSSVCRRDIAGEHEQKKVRKQPPSWMDGCKRAQRETRKCVGGGTAPPSTQGAEMSTSVCRVADFKPR